MFRELFTEGNVARNFEDDEKHKLEAMLHFLKDYKENIDFKIMDAPGYLKRIEFIGTKATRHPDVKGIIMDKFNPKYYKNLNMD